MNGNELSNLIVPAIVGLIVVLLIIRVMVKNRMNKRQSEPEVTYLKDPVSDQLADELRQKGYSTKDLNRASDFAKNVAEKMFDENK